MESGIGDFFGERFEAARKERIRTLKDYLPLFADRPLKFEPGTGRQCSNGGYIVLGLIIERAAAMDYYDYIEQNIFAGAKMERSAWFEKSDSRLDVARGYTGEECRSNVETLPQRGSSAGGGYCSAEDLLKYVLAIGSRQLQLPGSEQGLGIAGGAPGLNAALEWMTERRSVQIVLSNFDPPSAERVVTSLRRTLPRSPAGEKHGGRSKVRQGELFCAGWARRVKQSDFRPGWRERRDSACY